MRCSCTEATATCRSIRWSGTCERPRPSRSWRGPIRSSDSWWDGTWPGPEAGFAPSSGPDGAPLEGDGEDDRGPGLDARLLSQPPEQVLELARGPRPDLQDVVLVAG